jgi:serine/threonine-protein kinase
MGIVHRDLKPENVMIVETPGGDELKIMDFGLAKVLDSGTGVTESVSVAGTAIGTLGYMAPEVLNGGVVDGRADLFAIGVMVVETLVGTRPFGGQTPQEILTALLQTEYHLPGESAEIRALDAVVQRCLAKDSRERYGSAADLAKDLVPTLVRVGGFDPHRALTISDSPTLGDWNARRQVADREQPLTDGLLFSCREGLRPAGNPSTSASASMEGQPVQNVGYNGTLRGHGPT